MSSPIDDILDNHLHFCALRAYMEVASETHQFPPDSETTRRRANRYYEEALAEKNARRSGSRENPPEKPLPEEETMVSPAA
jgi:hypothetical protein